MKFSSSTTTTQTTSTPEPGINVWTVHRRVLGEDSDDLAFIGSSLVAAENWMKANPDWSMGDDKWFWVVEDHIVDQDLSWLYTEILVYTPKGDKVEWFNDIEAYYTEQS